MNHSLARHAATSLNESPSEKEGKCQGPKHVRVNLECLNESPSEKEGKSRSQTRRKAVNSEPQ